MVMVEGMFRALVARHEFISPLFSGAVLFVHRFFFSFFLPLVLGIDCSSLISWRLFLRVWLGVGPFTVWTGFDGGTARPPPHPQRRQEGHRQQVRIEV